MNDATEHIITNDTGDSKLCTICTEKLIISDSLTAIDLNEEQYEDVLKKLTRLNLTNSEIFKNNTFPKIVCSPCISSLSDAYDFVLKIERAQCQFSISVKVEHDSFTDDDIKTQEDPSYLELELPDGVKKESEEVTPKKEKDLEPKVKKKCAKRKSQFPSHLIQPINDLQTWKDYKWMCFTCNEVFPDLKEFKSHSLQQHGKCNMYRCVDCKHRKFSLDSFIEHIMTHRKHLKTSCPFCDCKITSFYNHKNAHTKSDYVCNGCNEIFETSKELIGHKNAHFSTRGKVAKYFDEYICDICKRSFTKKFYIMQHMKKAHMGRNKNYTCEWCGKSYYEKCHLKEHVKEHTNEKNHICKICNSAFKNKRNLKNHVATHSTEKPFACEICGRSFRVKKQLKSHSIIHTDIFPFSCAFCNKQFRFKTILNQHIRQHTGLKPYKCETCEKDFTNWPNYNKHMKRSHGLDMAKKKLTPQGVSYIDQNTGDYTLYECNEGIEEWKKEMVITRKRGRPKPKCEDIPENR